MSEDTAETIYIKELNPDIIALVKMILKIVKLSRKTLGKIRSSVGCMNIFNFFRFFSKKIVSEKN